MPRRRASKMKWLRFFGVLLVVAAVTVGVIMIIVPNKEKTAETKKDGSGTPENAGNNERSGGSDSSIQELDPSGNKGRDVVSSGKNNDSEKRETEQTESSSEEQRESVSTVDGDKKDPVLQIDNTGKSDVPGGKGRALPDDLPQNEDKPVFQSNQAPGAAEALSKAATLNDPDDIIAVAVGFLMKEYSAGGVYSANWNAVGQELASALRKKAAKNDWKRQAVIHKVVPRDHLIKIARRNSATVEGIKFFNKRKNNIIRIGDKLTVVPGPWRITLSKKARLLNLWRKEKDSWQIFAVFPIGIGRKNLTPVGKFVIIHRLRHPKWHGPDGRIFAYGDKENPLGDYFLKLRRVSPHGVKKDEGYGIHGSADDSSMGRSLSNGCIRMKNCDVEILYYLLPEMTPVEITD